MAPKSAVTSCRPTSLVLLAANFAPRLLIFFLGARLNNFLPAAGGLSVGIAPEVSPLILTKVSRLVSAALGDHVGDGYNGGGIDDTTPSSSKRRRYESAREAAWAYGGIGVVRGGGMAEAEVSIPIHELVYGELSVPVLATILDAVGVRQDGETFLDIGSGDGGLVLGASLLYADSVSNPIRKAQGIEIVPNLVDRSRAHLRNMENFLAKDSDCVALRRNRADVKFLLGDVHRAADGTEEGHAMTSVLADTTLAVCFATTWSADNARVDDSGRTGRTSLRGRVLPRLSRALSALPPGARVVIIDGKLDTASDGFDWLGDLRIICPDTAPYSTASLYCRL